MSAPTSMMAVVTTGNGGYDKLDYREVPTPTPGPTDVLLKVHAAGVNNTEINTRLGWYSSSVETATSSFSAVQSTAGEHKSDGGWNDATPFPIIQGTDCCGSVVAVGADVETSLIGQRGLFALVCVPGDGAIWTMSGWPATLMARLPSMSPCQQVNFLLLIPIGLTQALQPYLVRMPPVRT